MSTIDKNQLTKPISNDGKTSDNTRDLKTSSKKEVTATIENNVLVVRYK